MKKVYVALVSLGICSSSIAGLNGPTHHSRANCGNNESISWDATANHMYGTLSDHFSISTMHEVNTGWVNTWRCAAVHWGEASFGAGWKVIGTHWEMVNGVVKNVANETVTDCSIYDGWWNTYYPKNKEEQSKILLIEKEEINKLKRIPKGITIVSMRESALPEIMKKDVEKRLKNKLSLGYEHSDNPYIKNLSQYNLLKQSKTLDNNDPYDTHLKSNLSFVKLIFPYQGISFVKPEDIIGYAVMGSWIKDKNGWDGISTFFNYKDIGICVYRKQDYLSYGGGAQLNKEETTFDIGGYPTVSNVEGNTNDGFIYLLKWFDKEYFNDLDCYNKKFDCSLEKELINLGNRIAITPVN